MNKFNKNTAIKTIICIVAYLVIFSPVVSASDWVDPSWERMIEGSDLIVHAVVVQGGRHEAVVRVLKVFKGKKTLTDIKVIGLVPYNNWPKGQDKYFTGERYYLFLRQRYNGYAVWTQTAGALLEKPEGRVRHDLFETTDFTHKTTFSANRLEAFIANAIEYFNRGQPNTAYLDSVYQAMQTARQIEQLNPEIEAYQLMMLHLLGENRDRSLWKTIAKHGDTNNKRALVSLLSRIQTDAAESLLITLAGNTDSLVQKEAVTELMSRKLDPETLGPILLKNLAFVKTVDYGLHKLSHEVLAAKKATIRVVASLQYTPAIPALEKFLQGPYIYHDVLFKEAAIAIHSLGSDAYTHYFNGVLRGEIWGSPVQVAQLVGEWRVTACRDALEAYWLTDHDVEFFTPISALGKIGDYGTGVIIHDRLQTVLQQPIVHYHELSQLNAYIAALTKLEFQPARKTVEQAIHYWYGIDILMASKPWMLDLRLSLERACIAQVRAIVGPIEVGCLIHIENLQQLAKSGSVEPVGSTRIYVRAQLESKTVEQIASMFDTPKSFIYYVGQDEQVDLRLSDPKRVDIRNSFAAYAALFPHPDDADFMKILSDKLLTPSHTKFFKD